MITGIILLTKIPTPQVGLCFHEVVNDLKWRLTELKPLLLFVSQSCKFPFPMPCGDFPFTWFWPANWCLLFFNKTSIPLQNALLPASERCRIQTKKEPTGPFDRDALVDFLEKSALEEPDWEQNKPFVHEVRGESNPSLHWVCFLLG